MKIRRISLCRVQIPFKQNFRHAAAERSATDNIVVETELADGSLGYGEGLPRDYVTGETPESVMQSLQSLKAPLFEMDIPNFEACLNFLESELAGGKNFSQSKSQNSARCALELSLLDAFCRSFRKNLSEAVPSNYTVIGPKPAFVHYDGVLSLDSFKISLWKGIKLKLFGFRRVKIKLAVNEAFNLKILKALRGVFGSRVDLRVDVNGAWSLETALQMSQALCRFGISSIEQPLSHADLLQMAELKKKSKIPLMLDESLCSLEDARVAVESHLCDYFNIRLSKCGGWLNSMKLAALARDRGLGFQLGCMVGETGILSAAGRHFAFLNSDFRYLEGSYDRFLLKDNITRHPVGFGWRGRAGPLAGFGLGVEVDPAKLRAYSVQQVQIYG